MSNKTHKALAKRVKVSAHGKFMRRRAGLGHNLRCKSRRRKRFLKHLAPLSKPLARKARRMLPGI